MKLMGFFSMSNSPVSSPSEHSATNHTRQDNRDLHKNIVNPHNDKDSIEDSLNERIENYHSKNIEKDLHNKNIENIHNENIKGDLHSKTIENIHNKNIKGDLHSKNIENNATKSLDSQGHPACGGQSESSSPNEELNSTNLIPDEDNEHNEFPNSVPANGSNAIPNVSTIHASEDVIHMSFDSDEEDAKLNANFKSKELTNVANRGKFKNSDGRIHTSSENTVSEAHGAKIVRRINSKECFNETLNNDDLNMRSESIVNSSLTNDNCDISENGTDSLREKSFASDNMTGEANSNETSPNNGGNLKAQATVSTGGLRNSFGFNRPGKSNTRNSSALPNGGFLGRLARFRSDAKTIADIDKPKEDNPRENLEVVSKVENVRPLDRFRKTTGKNDDLPKESNHVKETVIENIDGNMDDVNKDDSKDNSGVLVLKNGNPSNGSREKYLSPWGNTLADTPTEQCEVMNIIDDMPFRRRSTNSYKCSQSLSFDVASLREKLKEKHENTKLKSDKVVENKFRAKIDPSKNNEAESELSRVISRSMFNQMVIVGQFNLGKKFFDFLEISYPNG